MLQKENVGILCTKERSYPTHDTELWFRPSEKYSDRIYDELGDNRLYGEVRELFHLYHMDDEHYGSSEWNPMGEIIKPGDNVLLKPNMVMDYNQNKNGGTDCLYTQPAIVVPIIDYVLKAIDGNGTVIIGDAPMQECDFTKLIKESGYEEILEYYRNKGVNIELVDFRGLTTNKVGIVRHQSIREDAKGTVIDLTSASEFDRYDKEHLNKLRITNYSPDRLKRHHQIGKHEYYVSEYLLVADVVINIPKPKTHRKAGYTAALKNMVGINVRKEYLPHHTLGSESEQGDEYKKKSALRRIDACLYDCKNTYEGQKKYIRAAFTMLFAGGLKVLTKLMYKTSTEGSWYGNKTISKTIVDLNKILLYADKNGDMKDIVQRKVLSIGDMIICGEKEGPVSPSPKKLGILVIGLDSFNFDKAVGFMMGADISRIPVIRDVIDSGQKYSISIDRNDRLPIIVSNDERYTDKNRMKSVRWNLIPSNGWDEVFELGKN